MNGSCHCGAVTIEVPARPEYLNQCNCTACHKLGTLWGYYRAGDVRIAGDPQPYVRADGSGELAFNFCARCGATTHWGPAPGHGTERRGINMRLFEPEELAGVEVRYGDRRSHGSGGPGHYARGPSTFGAGGAEL